MAYIVRNVTKQGSVQICYCTSERIKGKKNPKQTRKYLGMLKAGTNELLLAKTISELSEEELNALKENKIEFYGNIVPSLDPIIQVRRSDLLKDCITKEVGTTSLLTQISADIKLTTSLENAFGKEIAEQISCVGIYENCTQNPFYRLQAWAENTPFGDKNIGLSATSMTRLCKNIGDNDDQVKNFFNEWIKHNNYPTALVCDNTSISSYAKNISFLEKGYNRDGEMLNQLNLTNVFSRTTMLPLFYRITFGSVNDVTTVINTANLLTSFGIKNYSLALDRGFFSKENLHYFLNNKIAFTIGVPCGRSNEAQRILKESLDTICSPKNNLRGEYSNYFHAKHIFNLENDNPEDKENSTIPLAAHVYLDTKAQTVAHENLTTVVNHVLEKTEKTIFTTKEAAEKRLNELKLSEETMSMFFIKEQPVSPDKTNEKPTYAIEIDEEQYQFLRKTAGLFMILNSDLNASGLETLRDNKSRDLQEKVFDVLKNETGNNRLHVANDSTVKGKMFLAFIALIMHQALENKMRDKGILHKFTVSSLLDECKKFSVIRLQDGFECNTEIPLITRAIFELLCPGLLTQYGVKVGDVSNKIKQLQKTV
jgi:transposase